MSPACLVLHPFRVYRPVGHASQVCALLVALAAFVCAGCDNNRYEVVERSQKEVPNFLAEGTHTEVDYVLQHEGYEIQASCDITTVDHLDPEATCGFRPLKRYDCVPGEQSGGRALSDLRCMDDDGRNVYLYVTKKEYTSEPGPPLTLITALIALQLIAFGWRINREIPLGDQGRRTWFPLPDWINVLSFLTIVFSCVILRLVGLPAVRLSNTALAVGYSLIALHPISEAAHYRLFSTSGRSIYTTKPNGDYPWITGQEIVAVGLSLAIATAVAVAALSK